MKADSQELGLHSLIISKDGLALAKLYDLYGEAVAKKLAEWYPKIANQDEAFILEAVNEAFFGYSKNPITFDPEKSTLKRFLEVAAERDLINLLEKEEKYLKKEDLPEDVELEENFWNSIKKGSQSTDGNLIAQQSLNIVNDQLAIYFDNEKDVTLARLILSGERDTESYSEILDIQNLSIQEQQEEVKRHKDRIKKVLDRNNVRAKLKNLLK